MMLAFLLLAHGTMAAARNGNMEGMMRQHSGVKQMEINPSGHSEPLKGQSAADQERMKHPKSGVIDLEMNPSGHGEPLREQSEAYQERMTRRKSGVSQSKIDPTGHSRPLKEQIEADQERSQSEISPTGEVKEASYLQGEHADQNELRKTQNEAHQATYSKEEHAEHDDLGLTQNETHQASYLQKHAEHYELQKTQAEMKASWWRAKTRAVDASGKPGGYLRMMEFGMATAGVYGPDLVNGMPLESFEIYCSGLLYKKNDGKCENGVAANKLFNGLGSQTAVGNEQFSFAVAECKDQEIMFLYKFSKPQKITQLALAYTTGQKAQGYVNSVSVEASPDTGNTWTVVKAVSAFADFKSDEKDIYSYEVQDEVEEKNSVKKKSAAAAAAAAAAAMKTDAHRSPLSIWVVMVSCYIAWGSR